MYLVYIEWLLWVRVQFLLKQFSTLFYDFRDKIDGGNVLLILLWVLGDQDRTIKPHLLAPKLLNFPAIYFKEDLPVVIGKAVHLLKDLALSHLAQISNL